MGVGAAAVLSASVVVAAAAQSCSPWAWQGGRSPGQAAGRPDYGRPIANATCAACHGVDGNSADPRYPKLAGQKADYLYGQLWAFKTGVRRSDIMAGVVRALSDAEIAGVASFYNGQTVRPDAITDARLAALGEQIFFAGVGLGMAPPCAMCHGARGQSSMHMMGMMANAPNLNGQHAAYIIDQLNRFASGERQSMVMGGIAAALGEVNRKAVAEYLSSLP